MFRRFAAFAAVLIAALLIFTVKAQDEPFDIGDEVTVLGETTVLMIYSEPDASSRIVEATVSGISLTIVGGPEESDEGVWWQIRSPSGTAGWVPYLVDNRATIGRPRTERSDILATSGGLSIGERVTIIADPFALMYEDADPGSRALEALVSGFQVTLMEGPQVVNDRTWWFVESPSGQQGWMLETIDGKSVFFTEMGLAALTPTATVTPVPTATSMPLVRINGTITTDRLNVRRGPGPEYDQVRQLSNGAQIIAAGRNNDGTWIQLDTTDSQWVNAQYLRLSGNVFELPVTFLEVGAWDIAGRPTGVRAVAETVLRIRGGPGSQYSQLSNPDTLRAGATVDIIGRSADGLYYKVNVDNRSGWINAQFVRLTGNTNAAIPVIEYAAPAQATPNTSSAGATTAPTASPNQCAGALPQRLEVGGQAQQALNRDPVRVQNEPGGGTTIFLLYPGNVVDVIAGPRCQNIGNSPATWWQIRGTNNWTGWVAEGDGSRYFLQPHRQ